MQPATTEADIKRQKLGVINIARRLHFAIISKCQPKISKALGDVAFLQESLANWRKREGHFDRAVRMMAEAAIAEAALDVRLTTTATAE